MIALNVINPAVWAGSQWLGLQRGAAFLWSRAGLMRRLGMRACKVAEGHLAASLLIADIQQEGKYEYKVDQTGICVRFNRFK